MASTTNGARVSVHDLDGDELKEFIAAHIAVYGFPPLAGAEEPEGDADGDAEGDDDDPNADGDAEGDDDDPNADGDEDWKAHSRRHEREAKRAKRALEQANAELEKFRKANQTAEQKALDDAKAEARAEAEKEFAEERRAARLEAAVTRKAASTFADPEDALIHVQRAISSGDIDPEDIFDDKGKVNTDALAAELDALLERKPHLAARPGGEGSPGGRSGGSTGAGRGSGRGSDLDALSIAEIDAQMRKKGRSD